MINNEDKNQILQTKIVYILGLLVTGMVKVSAVEHCRTAAWKYIASVGMDL